MRRVYVIRGRGTSSYFFVEGVHAARYAEANEAKKKSKMPHSHWLTHLNTRSFFLGLTIGLMGLDETNLHVLMASGSPQERIHAETVFTLLSRGKHWVLGKKSNAHTVRVLSCSGFEFTN